MALPSRCCGCPRRGAGRSRQLEHVMMAGPGGTRRTSVWCALAGARDRTDRARPARCSASRRCPRSRRGRVRCRRGRRARAPPPWRGERSGLPICHISSGMGSDLGRVPSPTLGRPGRVSHRRTPVSAVPAVACPCPCGVRAPRRWETRTARQKRVWCRTARSVVSLCLSDLSRLSARRASTDDSRQYDTLVLRTRSRKRLSTHYTKPERSSVRNGVRRTACYLRISFIIITVHPGS